LDHPVVHPDLVARAQIAQILGMIDRRALGGADHRTGTEREGPAGLEVDPVAASRAERAEPDLGALQILQDCDRPAPACLALAHPPDDLGVLVGGAAGCSSGGRCEKLSRPRPRPAATRRSSSSVLLLAGPIVQTILVRRIAQAPASSGFKNCPVYERSGRRASSSGAPVATTRPP